MKRRCALRAHRCSDSSDLRRSGIELRAWIEEPDALVEEHSLRVGGKELVEEFCGYGEVSPPAASGSAACPTRCPTPWEMTCLATPTPPAAPVLRRSSLLPPGSVDTRGRAARATRASPGCPRPPPGLSQITDRVPARWADPQLLALPLPEHIVDDALLQDCLRRLQPLEALHNEGRCRHGGVSRVREFRGGEFPGELNPWL